MTNANASQLTGAVQVAAQGLFESKSTAQHSIGEYIMSNDGRGYRYCKADGNHVVGKLYQAKAEDTSNEQEITIVNASIGDNTIVSTDTVTLAVNLLAGGFLLVSEGTLGIGQLYKLRGNTAASGTVVTFNLEETVRVATTGTCKVDVKVNPYFDVVIQPQTDTSSSIGVAQFAITDDEFGWIQTHGICGILAQGTVTVGDNIVPANTSASGTVVAATDGINQSLGFALHGAATTDFALCFLTID